MNLKNLAGACEVPCGCGRRDADRAVPLSVTQSVGDCGPNISGRQAACNGERCVRPACDVATPRTRRRPDRRKPSRRWRAPGRGQRGRRGGNRDSMIPPMKHSVLGRMKPEWRSRCENSHPANPDSSLRSDHRSHSTPTHFQSCRRRRMRLVRHWIPRLFRHLQHYSRLPRRRSSHNFRS